MNYFSFYMIPVTRSGKTKSSSKTHVEQAAQYGQHDSQGKDHREINIFELHACDSALGLEEACIGQRVETKRGQNGGSVEHRGIRHGSCLLQNRSGENKAGGGRACDTGDEVGGNKSDHERAALIGEDAVNCSGITRAVLDDRTEADDSCSIDEGSHTHRYRVADCLAVGIPVAGEVLKLQNNNCKNAAEKRKLNLDLEDIQDKYRNEHGDNREDPVRTLLGIIIVGLLFFKSAGAVRREVALASRGKTLLIPLDVKHTDNDENDGNEQAEETAGTDIGAKVAGTKNVIGDRNPGNSQTEVQAE